MTRKCPSCGKPFPKGEPYPDVENCEVCERFGPPKIEESNMPGINDRVGTDPRGKLTTRRGFQMTPDQLQNEILVLSHHIDDIETAVKENDSDYAMRGLKDCREIVDRLAKFLPNNQASEIERMAESIPEEYSRLF